LLLAFLFLSIVPCEPSPPFRMKSKKRKLKSKSKIAGKLHG